MYKKYEIGQYEFFVFESQIDEFGSCRGDQKFELAEIVINKKEGVILKGKSLIVQVLEQYLCE